MRKVAKAGVLIILTAFLTVSLHKNIASYYSNKHLYETFLSNLSDSEAKNKKLKGEIAKSKDPSYIERILRDKLNRSKPGERVIVLPSFNTTPTPTPEPTLPPYRQWIELLF